MFQSKGIKYCICQAMMGTLSDWKVCKSCGLQVVLKPKIRAPNYWTFNWYFHAYIYQTVWLRKRKGNAGAARQIYSLTRKIARQASWLRISIARASSFPAQSKLSSRRLIYICKYQPGFQTFYSTYRTASADRKPTFANNVLFSFACFFLTMHLRGLATLFTLLCISWATTC